MKSTFYNEQETKEKLADFILETDILSMGEQCKQYELVFAKKQQRKYAVFVSSGSMANLVLIQALLNIGKIKQNDKVAVSALTWATNIMPVLQLGLKSVVVDCEKNTLNVSVKMLDNLKCNNLNVLFLTNVLGFSDNIQEIREWCDSRNILLLEDNCESLGSRANGKMLGNFGLASTFSTFVGHHLSTIEGGFVCTDDKELYDMLLMVRAHGWDRNLDSDSQQKLREKHKTDDFFARYTFYDLAFNARPTEIQGFIGNQQIQYWDEIVGRRADNFQKFQSAIGSNDDFISLDLSHMDIISNFAVPVVCKTRELVEKYKKKFKDMDVEVRPIIAGDITQQPFYKKHVSDSSTCENAGFIHENGFYFPNNPELTENELSVLSSLLKK